MANTTTNMGLKIWNLLTDLFSHSDLANNLVVLDAHDHTSGKGVQLGTGSIANAAITAAKVANATITSAQISSTAGITGTQLAGGTITSANLASGSVTTAAIASGAVTSTALASAAVTTAALASGAVTTAAIASGAVTLAACAPGVPRLSPTLISGSTTATDGQLLVLTAGTNNATITLPSPTSGRLVGVVNPPTTTFLTNTITTSGGVIFGPGMGSTGNATMANFGGSGAFVILQANGTNWNIVGGVRDSGWVTATLTTGVTTSVVAPACRLIGDMVFLRGAGQLSSGSGGPSLCTLPSFAAPATLRYLSVVVFDNSGLGSYSSQPLEISGTAVFLLAGTVGFTTIGNTIHLDGISYSLL